MSSQRRKFSDYGTSGGCVLCLVCVTVDGNLPVNASTINESYILGIIGFVASIYCTLVDHWHMYALCTTGPCVEPLWPWCRPSGIDFILPWTSHKRYFFVSCYIQYDMEPSYLTLFKTTSLLINHWLLVFDKSITLHKQETSQICTQLYT